MVIPCAHNVSSTPRSPSSPLHTAMSFYLLGDVKRLSVVPVVFLNLESDGYSHNAILVLFFVIVCVVDAVFVFIAVDGNSYRTIRLKNKKYLLDSQRLVRS